jgi:hypothetical protein
MLQVDTYLGSSAVSTIGQWQEEAGSVVGIRGDAEPRYMVCARGDVRRSEAHLCLVVAALQKNTDHSEQHLYTFTGKK